MDGGRCAEVPVLEMLLEWTAGEARLELFQRRHTGRYMFDLWRGLHEKTQVAQQGSDDMRGGKRGGRGEKERYRDIKLSRVGANSQKMGVRQRLSSNGTRGEGGIGPAAEQISVDEDETTAMLTAK